MKRENKQGSIENERKRERSMAVKNERANKANKEENTECYTKRQRNKRGLRGENVRFSLPFQKNISLTSVVTLSIFSSP
jgi:hypothetical protein